ncbi:MAG: hypothetical protein ACE37F_07115 [Nannocystaceae bacterium]|nr:hypothetical protein [bacterium]
MRRLATRWLGAALGLVCAVSCNRSDVGAPCQHAGGDVPSDPLISFPALACDQLLCVFGESRTPPEEPCESDTDCASMAGVDDFVCEEGRCVVAQESVLQRSMCSATCESDAECSQFADGTRCETGFSCAPLMRLGDFCCEKVCVCNDALETAVTEQLAQDCAAGDVPGCCDQDVVPDGCF